MAALHLLPRELIHLLASRPAFPAASTSASCSRLSGVLFAQQLPRFSSDYRRVALDSETARDFDRPVEGYEYPSIAGEQQGFLDQASFIEEDEADYRFNLPKTSTLSAASSSALAERAQDLPQRNKAIGVRAGLKATPREDESSLSNTHMLHLAMNNSANCLKRGEFDSALAWFIDAPLVSVAFANQHRKIAELASELRHKLMQERAENIPLLMSFATSYASKGLIQALPRMIPHIARFSTYERLKPFWNNLAHQARRTCKLYRPASSMIVLERMLIQVENRVVRTLVLSENYVDALSFLKDTRSQDNRPADLAGNVVEYDTYRIFLEELKRHDTHPALHSEVESLFAADYGTISLVPPMLEDVSHTTPSIGQNLGGDSRPVESGQSPVEAPGVNGASGLGGLQAVYENLRKMALRGETIDRRVLQKFCNSCVKNDAAHLARSLARVMAKTTAEKQYNSLVDQMSRGELPSLQTLSSFMDDCTRGKQLDLAARLGRWMDRQGLRFRSLWACAQIHSLVQRGRAEDARQALQLYKQHFLPNGLPAPIIRHFHTLGDETTIPKSQQSLAVVDLPQNSMLVTGLGDLTDERPVRERLLLPASSHSIALVIQAWLVANPQEVNVMETYRSFLEVSYAENDGVRVPTHLMPDQVSFGPFLKTLSRHGKHVAAMRVLEDMRARGVQPNAHNWDTVIGAFAKAGNVKVVGHIIRRMERAQQVLQGKKEATGEEPLAEAVMGASMSDYLMVTSTRFDPDLGDIHRLLEGFQFYPPTLVTYTTTIRGFALAGRLDRAKYYMRKMFIARDLNGDLLYRFGRSPQAEKVLDIVAKMSNLADVGRRISHRRMYTKDA